MADIEGLDYLSQRIRSCFVYGCFSTAANKPILGFHKFPPRGKRNIVVVKKNGDKCIYDRRQLWIEALNIGINASLAIDGVDVYVCSLHFAREDFYYNQDITGRRYLKENAIPRRNLPVRKTSPLTTKFNIRTLNRIKYRGHFNIHNPDGRRLTAPRTSLGTSKSREVAATPLYTKTVWVVRKPLNADEQQAQISTRQNNEKIIGGHDSKPKEKSQIEDLGEETEDDDQCTILETENGQQNNNPWFTSELIIKEEPFSDSEQEPQDSEYQKDEESIKILNGAEDGADDDDDDGFGPNKLVIETEEESEHDQTSAGPDETVVQAEELVDNTAGEYSANEDGYEHETINLEECEQPEIETLEEYDEEEQLEYHYRNYEGNYDFQESLLEVQDDTTDDSTSTQVQVKNSEDYGSEEYLYTEGSCYTCGAENCEEHSDYDMQAPDDNYFVCLICSEIFQSQKQLAIHSVSHQEMSEEELLVNEEKIRNLTCEFCNRVLSTKSTLREHIMIHTGEKPHKCLLCGKCFRHKANLVVHVNSHAVVSTYKCKKCNKAFTKKMEFEKHLKYHVDASGNPLVCKICNAVFKSQRTLYNHSQLHSKKGMVRAKKRNEGLRDSVHVCKICGKVLSTKATLKEHTMIHSGEKPHECPICGRMIRHKANYVVHVQTHGQGKSYECDMCDEAFMRRSDLTQHKQNSHSKSKLLRCPICSEVFKSPIKFNRHMEIHESVVYMNETEEFSGFQPHLLEELLET